MSARLESLEQCVQNVTTTMQRMLKTSSKETVSLPAMPVPSAPPAEDIVSFTLRVHGQGYAAAAAAPPAVAGHQHLQVNASGQQQGQPGTVIERSKLPAIKRKQREGDSEDGFKKQDRPRKTAKGASKVQVDGVGDNQPSLQYYVGNTPGKASPDMI